MAEANGNTTNGATAAPAQTISVLAQYIRDFSFENPNAPRSLTPQKVAPNIQLSVNVTAKPLGEADFEVELALEGGSATPEMALFKFDLKYAAVMRLAGFPQEHVHPVVMIEGPRLIFPFAREIIARAVQQGGFPPFMIDPIDFVTLYQRRAAELKSRESGATKLA